LTDLNLSPAPKRRSKRLYVLWAIALTLLLAAALFSWRVVVPVWQVRPHLAKLAEWDSFAKGRDLSAYGAALRISVQNLGGPTVTARRVARYLKYPQWIAPYRDEAYHVLMECGEQGKAALRELVVHGRPDERKYAAETLKTMQGLEEPKP
jgi:hypothetical protein